MTEHRYLETLQAEAAAMPDTFTLKIRADLAWDAEKFATLERAMREVCIRNEGSESLPRWLVSAFWTWCVWVPDWSSHPDFPRPDPEYFEACMTRLRDLEMWFFALDVSPYEAAHEWADLDAGA